MENKHSHKNNCCQNVAQSYGVHQTLQEMEFERGIWMAAKDGDFERVQKLLNEGVSPNMEDSAGYRPLHYAARSGHYRICELLLNKGAEVNAITRCVRATALHRAATQGHSEVVNTLLHHGADVNLKDADGSTALHRALSALPPRDEIFKLLIPKANLKIRDGAGRTAEDLAIKNCQMALRLIQRTLKNQNKVETEKLSLNMKNKKTVQSNK